MTFVRLISKPQISARDDALGSWAEGFLEQSHFFDVLSESKAPGMRNDSYRERMASPKRISSKIINF